MAQTYPHWELLIMDDGSTDNTADIARRFTADSRVHYQKLPKQISVYRVRNLGYPLTQGEFITYLDGDDLYTPHAFATWIQAFEASPKAMVVKGFHTSIDEQGKPIPNKGVSLQPLPSGDFAFPPGFTLDWSTIFNVRFPSELGTGLYRRQVFETVENFKEALTHTEDYGFFIRLFLRYPKGIHFVPVPVLKYRKQAQSITKNPAMIDQVTDCHLKVLDDVFKHPLLPPVASAMESYAYLRTLRRLARRQLNLGRSAYARKIAHQAWQHPKVKKPAWLPAFYGIYLQSFLPLPVYDLAQRINTVRLSWCHKRTPSLRLFNKSELFSGR